MPPIRVTPGRAKSLRGLSPSLIWVAIHFSISLARAEGDIRVFKRPRCAMRAAISQRRAPAARNMIVLCPQSYRRAQAVNRAARGPSLCCGAARDTALRASMTLAASGRGTSFRVSSLPRSVEQGTSLSGRRTNSIRLCLYWLIPLFLLDNSVERPYKSNATPVRGIVNLEGYVRSAAQCCGLRECGPHISRIERRRGSLVAMGKSRAGGVWRRGRGATLPEDRCREGAKRLWEIWLGNRTRRLWRGKAGQGTRWRRGSAPRALERRRRHGERRG